MKIGLINKKEALKTDTVRGWFLNCNGKLFFENGKII